MPLSIACAFAIAVVASVVLARRVFSWGGEHVRSASEWGVVRAFGIGGMFLGVVPALLLSIVVGGNLGGGWGEALLGPLAGVPIGLAAGIVVVFSVSPCLSRW